MAEPFIEQQDEEEIQSMTDLLDLFERAVKGDIDTAFVGQVQTYDASTQTCSVKPVIQARFLNGDALDLPVVPRVPVCFPRGGGFMMTWPLEAGDTVLVVCADRSIDEWKATNNSSILPVDLRRFDLSDAVAYAGVSSPAAPLQSATDDSMVIGEDTFSGMKITIKDGTVTIGISTVELLDLIDGFADVMANAQAVTTLGNTPLITTSTAFGVPGPVLAQLTVMKNLLAQIKG